jgi:hypothetical protein
MRRIVRKTILVRRTGTPRGTTTVHTADMKMAATTAAPAAKAATPAAVQLGHFTRAAPKLQTGQRNSFLSSRRNESLV